MVNDAVSPTIWSGEKIIAGLSWGDRVNADRIVACVNGCAGLRPEFIGELVREARLTLLFLDDLLRTGNVVTHADSPESTEYFRTLHALGAVLYRVAR